LSQRRIGVMIDGMIAQSSTRRAAGYEKKAT
jgi:hypothetical protein